MAAAFGGKQAPPFGKKDFAKKGKKKMSKSAPAQKALRQGGSMRGGARFGK